MSEGERFAAAAQHGRSAAAAQHGRELIRLSKRGALIGAAHASSNTAQQHYTGGQTQGEEKQRGLSSPGNNQVWSGCIRGWFKHYLLMWNSSFAFSGKAGSELFFQISVRIRSSVVFCYTHTQKKKKNLLWVYIDEFCMANNLLISTCFHHKLWVISRLRTIE